MICKKEPRKKCMCLRRKHDGCSECQKNAIKIVKDLVYRQNMLRGNNMYICFVCGKPVTEDDEFVWHGLDGEKIHKSCEKNSQKAYDRINNMTDEEFGKYLLGEI